MCLSAQRCAMKAPFITCPLFLGPSPHTLRLQPMSSAGHGLPPVQSLPTYRVHLASAEPSPAVYEDVVGAGSDAGAIGRSIAALVTEYSHRPADSDMHQLRQQDCIDDGAVVDINSAAALTEALARQGVAVIAYEAVWCRKCK
jgi:hypothetical protein